MPAPRKYPNELRERAIRLVAEARAEEPELSLPRGRTGSDRGSGVNVDTLRGWCKQSGDEQFADPLPPRLPAHPPSCPSSAS